MHVPAGRETDAIRLALHLLLSTQFVACRLVPNRLFRSILGSGMGLAWSSNLASAALWNRSEAALASERILSRNCIKLFLRYEDDVLMIASSREHARQWFHSFKDLAGYFDIVCESVGPTAEFLNIVTRFVGSSVVCSPRIKDSTLVTPLSCNSGHLSSLHRSWPLAYIRNLSYLATNVADFEKASRVIVHRFSRVGAPQFLVDMLLDHIYNSASTETSSKAANDCMIMWVPLSFHPCWEAPLRHAINKINRDPLLVHLFREAFQMRPILKLAWKRATRNLAEIVRN